MTPSLFSLRYGDTRLPERFWEKVTIADNGCGLAGCADLSHGLYTMAQLGITRSAEDVRKALPDLVSVCPAGRGGAFAPKQPATKSPREAKARRPLKPLKGQTDLFEEQREVVRLVRSGDFYEATGRDAEIVARVLQLTLTTTIKKGAAPLAMCGFPYHSYASYAAKLKKSGLRIDVDHGNEATPRQEPSPRA